MLKLIALAVAIALTTQAPAFADSTADKKAAFVKTVDESISGARIAGNPYKFVGKHVDLHCVVVQIPDTSFFNAMCGDGQDSLIAIQHDSKSLEQGQSVRVLGIVEQPEKGEVYGGGGSATFAVVKAIYLQ